VRTAFLTSCFQAFKSFEHVAYQLQGMHRFVRAEEDGRLMRK
jgi:hypothetical protein